MLSGLQDKTRLKLFWFPKDQEFRHPKAFPLHNKDGLDFHTVL